MELSHLLSFALIATLLVMSPGANGVLIAKTVSMSGRTAGFANVAGFVTAFYLHGALSIFGISLLLTQSKNAFLIAKLFGALYLCWLGVKVLKEVWGKFNVAHPEQGNSTYRKRTFVTAFSEGFLTNALNPKVSLFYLAAFPQFISIENNGVGSSFSLVVLHSAINAIWFSSMIILFDYFVRANSNHLFQRLIKNITGIALIGFGIVLATTTL